MGTAAATEIVRIGAKLYAENPEVIDLPAYIPLFHGWIQERRSRRRPDRRRRLRPRPGRPRGHADRRTRPTAPSTWARAGPASSTSESARARAPWRTGSPPPSRPPDRAGRRHRGRPGRGRRALRPRRDPPADQRPPERPQRRRDPRGAAPRDRGRPRDGRARARGDDRARDRRPAGDRSGPAWPQVPPRRARAWHGAGPPRARAVGHERTGLMRSDARRSCGEQELPPLETTGLRIGAQALEEALAREPVGVEAVGGVPASGPWGPRMGPRRGATSFLRCFRSLPLDSPATAGPRIGVIPSRPAAGLRRPSALQAPLERTPSFA